MPKDFERKRRIGEQLQRELAQMIQQEIKDPRVGMVTVSAVDVSRDLGHAKVFVTVFDAQADHKETIVALQHAAGFLQFELGKRLSLRHIPKLNFIYDESIVRGSELSSLIDTALASDAKSHTDDDTDNGDSNS